MAETLNMNAIYHPSISYPGIYYGNVILSKYPIVDHTILTFSSISENRTGNYCEGTNT
ncbi:hypothetical protein KHA80_00360 [Anaerobacillus sp. HL2]|nr:hypothetical protein KHA80_00360 [Anaerobacillus sp. HL2]